VIMAVVIGPSQRFTEGELRVGGHTSRSLMRPIMAAQLDRKRPAATPAARCSESKQGTHVPPLTAAVRLA